MHCSPNVGAQISNKRDKESGTSDAKSHNRKPIKHTQNAHFSILSLHLLSNIDLQFYIWLEQWTQTEGKEVRNCKNLSQKSGLKVSFFPQLLLGFEHSFEVLNSFPFVLHEWKTHFQLSSAHCATFLTLCVWLPASRNTQYFSWICRHRLQLANACLAFLLNISHFVLANQQIKHTTTTMNNSNARIEWLQFE